MKSLYQWFRNSGTEHADTVAEKMAIQNFNALVLIGVVTVWSYVPIDIFARDWPLTLMNFFTGVLYFTGFALVRAGYANFGKVFALMTAIVTIYLTDDAIGRDSLVHFYELGAVTIPFLCFARVDFKYMAMCTVTAFLFWVAAYVVPEHSIMPPAVRPELYLSMVPVIVVPIAIAAIVLQTYFLFHKLLALTERQKKELVNSSRMAALGEMSGGVAHEINSPLATIAFTAEFIRHEVEQAEVDRAKVEQRLQTIEKTVTRISKITQSLLAFSAFERKGPQKGEARALARERMEALIALYRDKFDANGIAFRVSLEYAPELALTEDHFQQLLQSLLNNSADAVQSLPEKWIELSGEVSSSLYVLRVRDSGTGIPTEIVDKIMEPFFTTKEIGKGTGLGLSLSKGLVESYGGRIYYELKDGHTSFVTELPQR